MKKLITICLVAAMILAIGGVANADWNVGDPNKMHYPQLPTMYGQDIEPLLADDWLCTESGAVTDVHFWTFNYYGSLPTNLPIYMTISSNNPNYNQLGYSAPDAQLWDRYFFPSEYTIRQYDEMHWQFNITDIENPFIQTEGTVYWLGLRIQMWDNPHFYWSYSDTDFMDNAVYWTYLENPTNPTWFPLSYDLAFVIVPEPTTICLLGLGALSVVRRKSSIY